MTQIMMCESSASTTIRSKGIMKNGKQENSWGLFQINLDAHSDVTLEEAIDPDFNINWAADQISRGNASWQWVTCYKNAIAAHSVPKSNPLALK